MNKNLDDYINRLRLEDIVWYIYGILVILNILSNKYEKKYAIYKDLEDRNTFRSINIFIFIVAVFIYAFFLIRNIKYNSSENTNKEKEYLNNLSIIASAIFIIGGIINLYVEMNGYNQELEI